MAASAGGVVISISGDSKDLQKALQDAAKSVIDLGEKTKKPLTGFDDLNKKLLEFDSISGTSFGGATSRLQGLSGALGTTGLVLGGVALAAGGIFAAFKFAEIGEELEKQKKQFDNLAASAGIVGDTLLAGLEKSAGGLVDTDDLIKIANGSIVKLGQSASELPALFEIAQKSAKVFGGESTQNLELISNAIGNLQTRSLKQIGINIDAEATFKAYAASLGITAEKLTEAEKKQALLNAVLEQGNSRFKDISTGVNDETISNGLKKIAVGFDNIKDSIAAIANTKLGGAFGAILNAAGEALSSFALSIDDLTGKQKSLDRQLIDVNAQLQRFNELQALNPNTASQYDEQIAALQRLRSELESNLQQEQLIAAEKQRQAEFNAIQKEVNRPDTEAEIAEAERKRVAIAEINAKYDAQELEATANQALLKAQAENPNGIPFEEKLALETQAKQQALDNQYNLEIAQAQKLKTVEERRAAEALALRKKELGEEALAGQNKVKVAEGTAQAKIAIEQNLFATASNLINQQSALGKALGVAQAIRNTYQGATLALATYPPPFNVAAAASTVALGLSQVAKITAANTGALVTTGVTGRDTEPFLLSKGEVVAPAKSFDEVVEGTARQRGFVKPNETSEGGQSGSGQSISITIQGDFIGDENYINRLTEKIREAVQFRSAELS